MDHQDYKSLLPKHTPYSQGVGVAHRGHLEIAGEAAVHPETPAIPYSPQPCHPVFPLGANSPRSGGRVVYIEQLYSQPAVPFPPSEFR